MGRSMACQPHRLHARGTSVGRAGKRFNGSTARANVRTEGLQVRLCASGPSFQRLQSTLADRIRQVAKNSQRADGKSQDEIFVMLFCRSVIQSAFMQKAQSSPTIILRNV